MSSTRLTSVFTRLQSRLRGVGRTILGGSDEVDDALQETFCKLWSQSDKLECADNLEAYTLRVMRNECIDTLRRHERQPVTVELSQCADVAEDGEDDTAETYRRVMRIVDSQLTALQRRVLTMRDVQGMAYDDIARELDLEPATVRVHLSRARRTVRNIYIQQQ